MKATLALIKTLRITLTDRRCNEVFSQFEKGFLPCMMAHNHGNRMLLRQHKYRKCGTLLKQQSCVAPQQELRGGRFFSTEGQLERLKSVGVILGINS